MSSDHEPQEIPQIGQRVFYFDLFAHYHPAQITCVHSPSEINLVLEETKGHYKVPHYSTTQRFARFWAYTFELDRAMAVAHARYEQRSQE